VMINVMYALEPDYRRRLWPVLAAQLAPGGLLIFTWRAADPKAARCRRQGFRPVSLGDCSGRG
jgi:hypothetical protein